MRTIITSVAVAALLALPACGGGGGGKDAKVAKADANKDANKDAKEDKKEDKKEEPKAEGPELPKDGLLVRHTVKDFAKWKEKFDAHQQARADAGIVFHVLLQEDGKDNNVLLGMLTSDVEKTKAFASSPDLKAVMADAGVEGAPDITWWKEVESKRAPEGTEIQLGLIALHKVKDYDAWYKGFSADADNQKKAGMVSFGILRGADDPNAVLVHAETTNAEAMKGMVDNPELKAAMDKAGVEEVEIILTKEVETKIYDAPKMAAAGDAEPPEGGSDAAPAGDDADK